MGKAVLISIRPEWVNKMITGEKRVEVRKTRPKLEPPFQCYVYMTKLPKPLAISGSRIQYDGHVMGEFTCTGIDEIKPANEPYGTYDIDDDYVIRTCLTNGAMWDYGKGKTLYGWNITGFRLRSPKPVSVFTEATGNRIERAPQSWCYVEV